jgi:hypothetical protein
MTAKIREIAFDTETTGLDPAQGERVIEIGAVEPEAAHGLGLAPEPVHLGNRRIHYVASKHLY